MGYKRLPGGYIDNEALNEAIRLNAQARNTLRRVLVEKPGRGVLYAHLAELAHALGDQLEQLNRMREIRLKLAPKTEEAPATQPGPPQTDDEKDRHTWEE